MVVTMGDIYKDSCRAEFRKFGSKNKVRKALSILSTLGKSHIVRGAAIGAGVTIAARGLAEGRAAGNVMSEQYGEGARAGATRAGVKAGLLSGTRDGRALAAGAIVGGVGGAMTRLYSEGIKGYAKDASNLLSPLHKNMSRKTKDRIKGAAGTALALGLGVGSAKVAGNMTTEIAKGQVPELEAELRSRQWAKENPERPNYGDSRQPRLKPRR